MGRPCGDFKAGHGSFSQRSSCVNQRPPKYDPVHTERAVGITRSTRLWRVLVGQVAAAENEQLEEMLKREEARAAAEAAAARKLAE